jgi:hypothetical protein
MSADPPSTGFCETSDEMAGFKPPVAVTPSGRSWSPQRTPNATDLDQQDARDQASNVIMIWITWSFLSAVSMFRGELISVARDVEVTDYN